MSVAHIQTSFAAGELSPTLFGHTDYAKTSVGASTLRNAFTYVTGGAMSRAGTALVGYSKQTGRGTPPRLITFQFSLTQGLVLEFGDLYMRVIQDGAYITEDAKVITNVTQANPAVVTVVGHGYTTGDWDFLSAIGGMTELNGQTYVINVLSADTFSLETVLGVPVDSSAFGAYTTGGFSAVIYTLTTIYPDQAIKYLKYAQSADVMSLTCYDPVNLTSYPPQDLTRLANNNWTIANPSFGSSIAAPANPTGNATVTTATMPTDYQYVITAIDDETGDESVASDIIDIPDSVNIATTAGSEELAWDAVTGAAYYNIYKALPAYASTVPTESLFGFCGTTLGTSFVDSNIQQDMSLVPPTNQNPFALAVQASGDIDFSGTGNPSPADTITLDGVVWTFVAGAAGPNEIGIAGTLAGTLFFGAIILNASTDPLMTVATYSVNGANNAFEIVFDAAGTIGNAYTLAASAATPSGPTLTGGADGGQYPSVVSYFQQRRVYANTATQPDTYFMSKPGQYTNFDTRIPTVDDDAITGTPWAVQVDGIQFIIPLVGGMLALTGQTVYLVTGTGGSIFTPAPVTPSSQSAQPQDDNGCSGFVSPVKVDYDIYYVQSKGSIVRTLSYAASVNSVTGEDITILATHLFTGYNIESLASCKQPYKLLWATRDDGILLSLTALKSEQLMAWGRHDTQGLFLGLTSVVEPPVDALYLVSQRFMPNGDAPYFIERMNDRIWNSVEDAWCVDCGVSLDQPTRNSPITFSSASGLGRPNAVSGLVGGTGYAASTTVTVGDPTGSGCVVTPTIVGGVITALGFAGGTDYTNPQLQFIDPTGAGSGASGLVVLSNLVNIHAAGAVFSGADVGRVIRAGGGIATVTAFTDTQNVVAQMTAPIVKTIPNTGGVPYPFQNGEWTITAPVTTVDGLDHLIGLTVTGLADGNVITPRVVSAQGTITLDDPATAIVVGLGFTAQLQTLYLEPGGPTVQGRRKKIGAATVRLSASRDVHTGANQPDGSTQSPIQIAPEWTNLADVENQGVRPYGTAVILGVTGTRPEPLYTGDSRVPLADSYQKPGQIAVEQRFPLPLCVLAVIPEAVPGDSPEKSPKDSFQ